MNNKLKFFILFILMMAADGWARTVYIPPVITAFRVGGYDTTATPKRYCRQSPFTFYENLEGTSFSQKKLVNGANAWMQISLRNVSATEQNVTINIEDLYLHSCVWKNVEYGLPDTCYTRYFNNAAKGYSIALKMAANTSRTLIFNFGCQGTTGNNNCWLFQQDSYVDGVKVANYVSHFGVLPLFDIATTEAFTQYTCYELQSTINLSVDVAEKKGSVVGSVSFFNPGGGVMRSTDDLGSIEMNGGRPF